MANLNETLDLVKASHQNPLPDTVQKYFTQGTGVGGANQGLTAYDLEKPAAKIVPVVTPLRNMCPRVKSNAGDTATRWKAITAVNTNNTHPGVSEGRRGGVIGDAVADYTASYVGLGLENSVTFEADYAAESFDDAKARAVENLLYAAILKEEEVLLGGNASVALGTTGTPALTKGGSGNTLPTLTYSVICVALTFDGYRRTSLASGIDQVVARTSADGLGDENINGGCAIKSAAATLAITLGEALTCTVAAKKGAVAYAWYVGGAGSEKLEAITTTTQVTFSKPLAGTGQAASDLASTDYSKQDGWVFDGFLYTALGSSASYYKAMDPATATTGNKLVADGKGGVNQINDALGWFWDNLQLQPDAIWANRQEINTITSLCVGSATSPFRFNVTGGSAQGSLVGGGKVTEYQSPVDSSIIPINIHPKMPAGCIMFTTRKLPYALNNVPEVFRLKARREWYQIEWPQRTRKYEYGIYCDEVFQHYFPPSLGVINNINADPYTA